MYLYKPNVTKWLYDVRFVVLFLSSYYYYYSILQYKHFVKDIINRRTQSRLAKYENEIYSIPLNAPVYVDVHKAYCYYTVHTTHYTLHTC